MTAQRHAQSITDETTDNVIAWDISEAEYMGVYAEQHTEWLIYTCSKLYALCKLYAGQQFMTSKTQNEV